MVQTSQVLEKGYLLIEIEGSVTNVIDYFAVKKGENYIRVVYNGASCGLNTATLCSNSWFPTSTALTWLFSYDYKVVDAYIGEIFPNFPIHESLKHVIGIDLLPFPDDISKTPSHQRTQKFES